MLYDGIFWTLIAFGSLVWFVVKYGCWDFLLGALCLCGTRKNNQYDDGKYLLAMIAAHFGTLHQTGFAYGGTVLVVSLIGMKWTYDFLLQSYRRMWNRHDMSKTEF